MPGPEMDFKRELTEAGNRLLRPPGSVDDLLALLDRVEHCLSFVEQQPPVEMQDALCPAFKALVTKELLKHADIDVRVGVTACLTEISRITAPDVPYGDQLMKEVFRLTISALEGLSDKSSKSFGKRISILETVARVRSCAVLLDLDCDGLVVEMFQNFYKCIRDFHTGNVFASMESIMTLVIEEYDEISADLLFALLSVLKRENQDASPVAKRLGEKVVQNCANKLKSCITEAIKSLKINLLDYDFVVTLACQVVPNHDPFSEATRNFPLMNGSESAMKTVEKEATPTPSLSPHVPPIGNIEIVDEDDVTQDMLNTSHGVNFNVVGYATGTILDQVQVGPGALTIDLAMNPEPVPLPKSEPKSEKITKKRGRKPMNAKDIMETDSSKLPQPDGHKQASESQVSEKSVSGEVLKAHHLDAYIDPKVPEKNCDSNNQLSPKAVENNVVNLGSQSLTVIPPEKTSSEMIRISEEPMTVQEATSSQQSPEKKPADELNDSETIHFSVEKYTTYGMGDASNFVSSVEVKNEQDTEGDSADNPPNQLGIADGTMRSKKRGRPCKDASMSVTTGVKDGVSSEGTSQKRSRLRFTFPEEGKEYGEDLIGTRIKVWWPQDREYYDGVVESYDPIRRRHRILYTDNERESLRLHRQKWKILKSRVGSEKDEVTSYTNAGDASDKQKGKKLTMDSGSAGTMGNTDSPLKRRRGRPPKYYGAPASYDSAVKDSNLEGQTKADEMDNDGNPIKSMDSVTKWNATNSNPENSEYNKLPETGGTQIRQDSLVGAGATDIVASKPAVRFDTNDPFTYRSDDESDVSETATTKNGNSNVGVTEEVKAGSATESKTVGNSNLKFSAFATGISSRKRKPRTCSISNSPALTGNTDTLTKRRRGRPPYKFLHQNSVKESKDVRKQFGDPKVDESQNVGRSDNLVVVKSKGFLDESRNAPYRSAECFNLKESEHVTLGDDIKKSMPNSMRSLTEEEDALAQNTGKSVTGELKFGSPTGLKIKFKTSVPEPKIRRRRRRSRKSTSSPSEQFNKGGSVKRPRGRPPLRLKLDVPNPEGNVNPMAVLQHRIYDSASVIKPDSEIVDRAGRCWH